MDAITIAIVSAATALVSAIIGPLVSLHVAGKQIRASVISNNRERWSGDLRDAVAEYVALVLTAAMVRQGMDDDPFKAVRNDRDLREIVERTALVKHKIMLMANPAEEAASELCDLVEATYQLLMSDTPPTLVTIRAQAEDITRTGRDVLRAEWARVKRGE
jgi:hypothetical protein